MSDLKEITIKIISAEIVTKGNENNSWKEIAIKVSPDEWEKGVHFSIHIKKQDGSSIKAYEYYKEHTSAWEDDFVNDKQVEVTIGYDEKVVDWERDGKKGTSKYRAIRFFKVSATQSTTEEVKDDTEHPDTPDDISSARKDDEIDVDGINLNI